MTRSRNILNPRHVWIRPELDYLTNRYPHEKATILAATLGLPLYLVYAKAKDLGLKKSEAFLRSAASGRLDGAKGMATRYQPGNVPTHAWRKGAQVSPATQFKPGMAPVNEQEVGALRINSMGDIDIKVAPGPRQWVSLRRYVWETERGPVPDEMCIAVKNHDPHDTRLENLVLLTRAENIAHNLLRRYPRELRCAMQMAGRIRNRIEQLEGDLQHA